MSLQTVAQPSPPTLSLLLLEETWTDRRTIILPFAHKLYVLYMDTNIFRFIGYSVLLLDEELLNFRNLSLVDEKINFVVILVI